MMRSIPEPASLSEFLDYQLPIIDRILARDVPLISARILQAAMMIVEFCLEQISGDTKDDYLKKPWFAGIYLEVEAWYERRYGTGVHGPSDNSTSGIVLIYDTAFELRIPCNYTENLVPGETIWVCFPNEVAAHENVIDWIIKPPVLSNMTEKEREALVASATRVANATRSCRIGIMTADASDAEHRSLRDGLCTHIEKAVQDILSTDPPRIKIAYWELHLALEKLLKLAIHQRGRIPPRSHDLILLSELAVNLGVSVNRPMLKALPTHHEAIRYRYGEGPRKSVRETVLHYHNALDLMAEHCRLLKKTFTFNNAKFQIKAPPWISKVRLATPNTTRR